MNVQKKFHSLRLIFLASLVLRTILFRCNRSMFLSINSLVCSSVLKSFLSSCVNISIFSAFLSSGRIVGLGDCYVMTSVVVNLCVSVRHSYLLWTDTSVRCCLESKDILESNSEKNVFCSLPLIASISGFPMFTTLIVSLFNRRYLLVLFFLLYPVNSQEPCDFTKFSCKVIPTYKGIWKAKMGLR